MTEHKFTDEEIKKGLECCFVNRSCKGCPQYAKDNCIVQVGVKALDLINRYEAENERLKEEIVIRDKIIDERGKEVIRHDNAIRSLHKQLDNLKSEAIKEFCEKRGIEYVETDI